jgi:hypothetical protein
MENWSEISRLVEGGSRRQILRETGTHWRTLWKMLKHIEPTGCHQCKPRTKRKLEAHAERIEQILKEDQAMPRKRRHTAKRIWKRLEGRRIHWRLHDRERHRSGDGHVFQQPRTRPHGLPTFQDRWRPQEHFGPMGEGVLLAKISSGPKTLGFCDIPLNPRRHDSLADTRG